ncbi:putative PurR-regulated permease PerM [Caldalkalibacillus uzonensis]|uniref:PurR-regulated permease PerM n=1 Tax=Caldalkalibacillus uzonensis TaxID=353224 RepID=A0ABU0CSZ7_9BACI|nr:AI-2E family transporter [Caldalkalibacillus uzonensis]MDQ0339547.1 putative PurR-regulated permease PerM [Caldalkalibacillus uzonensis]
MRTFLSLRGLIATGVIVLSLIILYLLFQVAPYLSPVFHLLATVFIPLFLAIIMAYLLHPVVEMLMRLKIKRSLAIILIYIFFFGGLFLAGWLLFPLLAHQIRDLMAQLPAVQNQLIEWYHLFDSRVEQLPSGLHEAIDDILHNFEQNIRRWVEETLLSLTSSLGHFFMLMVVPFFTFYLLNDLEGIQKRLFLFIPRSKRKMVFRLWRDIDNSLGEYIRGQLIVSFLVGVLAVSGYYLIGLPYALFLGTVAGVTNIIPYFGPIIGTVLSSFVALVTDPSLIGWVIGVNIVIQILEGNVINPYVVGKRLHIHPMFIILSLLVGAEVGGMIGLLLAVPVFVIMKVIVVSTVLHVRRYRSIQKVEDM